MEKEGIQMALPAITSGLWWFLDPWEMSQNQKNPEFHQNFF
jgi:hypothetical protein